FGLLKFILARKIFILGAKWPVEKKPKKCATASGLENPEGGVAQSLTEIETYIKKRKRILPPKLNIAAELVIDAKKNFVCTSNDYPPGAGKIYDPMRNRLKGDIRVFKAQSNSIYVQLSDKVKRFQELCSVYAENISPHGKFRFRELVANLDGFVQKLRSCAVSQQQQQSVAGAAAQDILQRTIQDLENVAKDLITASLSKVVY
uniref:F-actin binding domain-containing protein n=1 Tax=Romanomermis culicivorax TaxID=13658 RepID=A0A915IVT2_ROMCU